MQLTKAYVAEMFCNQLLIDTAVELLTFYSPTYIEEHINEPLRHFYPTFLPSCPTQVSR